MTETSPSRPLRKLAMSALVLALPSIALAAQVKGKVVGADKLLNPVWAEAKEASAHRYTWREPSPTVRAEFRSLFGLAPKEICIAAIAPSAQQAAPVPQLVTIGGGRTTPVTLVVTPGTRLHFENRDPFPHKLYAVGQSTFPPGETAMMGSRDWTAPGPGKYEIRDELSPSVRTWIVVDSNVAAVAYPGRDGSFTFGAINPGEYTLKAFFAGAPTGTPKPLVVGNGNMEMKEPLPVVEGADKGAPDAGAKG